MLWSTYLTVVQLTINGTLYKKCKLQKAVAVEVVLHWVMYATEGLVEGERMSEKGT